MRITRVDLERPTNLTRGSGFSVRLVRCSALRRQALEHHAIEDGLAQVSGSFEWLRQLGRQRRGRGLDDQQRARSICGWSKISVRREYGEDDERDQNTGAYLR